MDRAAAPDVDVNMLAVEGKRDATRRPRLFV
jgi:hypothetical protein